MIACHSTAAALTPREDSSAKTDVCFPKNLTRHKIYRNIILHRIALRDPGTPLHKSSKQIVKFPVFFNHPIWRGFPFSTGQPHLNRQGAVHVHNPKLLSSPDLADCKWTYVLEVLVCGDFTLENPDSQHIF